MNWRILFLSSTLLGLTNTALAEDDDWLGDDLGESNGDSKDSSKKSSGNGTNTDEEIEPDEGTLGTGTGTGLDLGEGYESVQIRGEGEDDADIYRKFKDSLERLDPAEESISWQEYLEEYPKSIFRPAIEQRLVELESDLYGERIVDKTKQDREDGMAEIKLTQPVFMSNIDPRQKVHVGVEIGFPSQFNILLDYEHQIKREMSVHGGVRSSISGTYFEPGVKYAFIKSARLQMLSTANLDILFGLGTPSNMGLRPTIGWGKRTVLKNDMWLDTMVQLGSELIVSPSFDPRLTGGVQVAIAPTEALRFFMESSVYMKDFAWDNGSAFAFNTLTFGIKFFDAQKGKDSPYEVSAVANLPYYYHYWRQHYGSITTDLNWYFD